MSKTRLFLLALGFLVPLAFTLYFGYCESPYRMLFFLVFPSWAIWLIGFFGVRTFEDYTLWLILMVPPISWIAVGFFAVCLLTWPFMAFLDKSGDRTI